LGLVTDEVIEYYQRPFRFIHLSRLRSGLGYSGHGAKGSTFSAHGVRIGLSAIFQLVSSLSVAQEENKRHDSKKVNKLPGFIIKIFISS